MKHTFVAPERLVDLGIVASRGALKVRLNRNKIVKRTYEVTRRGRELRISVESMLQHGWLTEEQASALIASAEQPTEKVEEGQFGRGHALASSVIVRKKFAELTLDECVLLDRLCDGWREMRQSQIVKALSAKLGVSRTWLYRDHSPRERKSWFEKIPDVDRNKIVECYFKSRTKKVFIDLYRSTPDMPPASTRTLYRWAREIEARYKSELLILRRGEVAARQNTAPILRDKTHLNPLDVVVGDYWLVDRIVEWLDGELVRPALSIWVDWRTNLIVGAALAKNPNSIGVKTSLLDCFLHYGIPRVAYMDNGKEYRAARVSGTNVEETRQRLYVADELESELKEFEHKGILPSLSIRSVNAIVRNPRAKVVERVFGRGGLSDWAKQFGDYIGRNYPERPEIIRHAIAHRRAGKTYVNKVTGEIFTFTDHTTLAFQIREFIDYHNNRPSKGFGMDGKSPVQLWTELVQMNPPRRASVREIALAFMEGRTARIRKSGYIEFKRDMFYSGETLFEYAGEDVHIRYNPIDGFWWRRADGMQHEFLPTELMVFDIEGRYLATATFVQRQHPTLANVRPLIAEQRKQLSEAKRAIGEIAGLRQKKLTVVDIKSLPSAVREHEERSREEVELEEKREQLRRQKRFGEFKPLSAY